MQKVLHIVMSLLVVIFSILQITELNFSSIAQYLITLILTLITVNFLTWLIHFGVEKGLTLFEKRKQSNYSMLTWLGDTNVYLDLYNELQNEKTFDRDNFHGNFEFVKQKIKQRYATGKELKGLRDYLEMQTNSQKYTAVFNTTQTILLGIIVPTVLTIFNFKNYTTTTVSLNAILFLTFWLILLNGIDFMSSQIDRMKVMLRLVKECIDEDINEP